MSSSAQSASTVSTLNTWGSLLARGKYLAALAVIEKGMTASPEDAAFLQQERAQTLAILGDVPGALDAWDKSGNQTTGPARPPYEPVTARDAVSAIVDRARDRQIVILNEAHHLSQDRASSDSSTLPRRHSAAQSSIPRKQDIPIGPPAFT